MNQWFLAIFHNILLRKESTLFVGSFILPKNRKKIGI